MKSIKLRSLSKEETKKLGETIANFLSCGDVILLKGDLGAGKTTFVGGVAKGLGITDKVISPTFNILKCYFKGKIPMYHIDAYRLEEQNTELGLDEFIEGDGVCLIEWPTYIENLIPNEYLEMDLKNDGENERIISVSSCGSQYDEIVSKLEAFAK